MAAVPFGYVVAGSMALRDPLDPVASALFLLSNKVASVTGPGTCVPSPDDCALLALPAGQSEDLLYTQDGETYRIVVAQINSSR